METRENAVILFSKTGHHTMTMEYAPVFQMNEGTTNSLYNSQNK
jgi:hypothetical protein